MIALDLAILSLQLSLAALNIWGFYLIGRLEARAAEMDRQIKAYKYRLDIWETRQ